MKSYHEYRLPDGVVIGGQDAADVIEAMAGRKLTTIRSRAGYRGAVGRRAKALFPEVNIDTSSDETLIRDLIAAGWLEPLS